MSKIDFITPVLILKSNFSIPPHKKNIARLLDLVESYFSWSGNFYKIVSGITHRGTKYVILDGKRYKKKIIIKFLILTSYFSIVIPLFIMILKLIHRKINKFALIQHPNNQIHFDTIKKKPIPIPIPSLDIAEIQPNYVGVYAESLNIDSKNLRKIKKVFDDLQPSDENLVWNYMKAILNEFNINEKIPVAFKRDILINIARDSGDDTCNEGKLTKIQKEYARLNGIHDNDINQMILSELLDLKMEILNQLATEIIPRDVAFHPHFISAAHVYLGITLGLDPNVGELDPLHTSQRVRPLFDKNKRHHVLNRFLELYTSETILDWLYQSINGKKDHQGITLNIGIYYKHIEEYLKKEIIPLPKSYKILREGPLNKYIEEDIENSSLKIAYEIALGNYISENYFNKTIEFGDSENFNLDCDLIKEINKEGITLILKTLKIFEN